MSTNTAAANELSIDVTKVIDARDEKWSATYQNTVGAFEYDDDGIGHLKEGAKEPTADDLLVVLEKDAGESNKTRARMATMLLFAKGKKIAGGEDAYDWLCKKMESKFKGDKIYAFNNAKGLIPCIEFMQQEKLKDVSVYTVKDVIGYINKRDLRGSDGRIKEEHRDEPIVKMLITDKKPVTEIRKALPVERKKYPDIFPPREGSKKTEATEEEAKKEAQEALNSDTLESVALALESCRERIGKIYERNQGKVAMKDLQKLIADPAKAIYVLAGSPKLK